MDRRDLLAGGAALAALAMAGTARAADTENHEHHHHHDAGPKYGLVGAAAVDCIQKGEVCIDHCLVLLGDGDKAMAACAKSVTQMLAICGALQRLSSTDFQRMPQLAKVAMDVCRDCEAECKKHADKHQQCRDCMESCGACARECQKIAA